MPKISLFSYLENLDFCNIQKDWKENIYTSKQISPTWRNKYFSSCIDYIWLFQELVLNNIYLFNNMKFDHITNSNHTLLQIILYRDNITNTSRKSMIKKRKPRTIFDFKKMDQEK